MQKLLFIVFITISFAQQPPEWINKTPIEPDYYIGIGKSLKANKEFSKYKKEANTSAFSDISSKIITAVYAASRYEASELNYDLTEQFSHQEETTTATELEGLEYGDSPYEDEKHYYVYWRLSKVKYEQSIKKYQNRALEYYKASLKAKNKDSIVDELSSLIKAFEFVFKAHDRDIKWKTKLLNIEIPSRLDEIANNIIAKPSNTQLFGKVDEKVSGKLIYRVQDKSSGRPVANVKISYRIVQGDIDIARSKNTDLTGKSENEIEKINSKIKDPIIIAWIDYKQWKTNPDYAHTIIDRRLDKLSKVTEEKYIVSFDDEKIAVKVLTADGFSKNKIKLLNDKFISSVSKHISVIERGEMEEILEENNAQQNCDTKECEVQLGKALSVRQVLFIKPYLVDGLYRLYVKLVDIETTDIIENHEFKSKDNFNAVLDTIPTWVDYFYVKMRQSKILFTSNDPLIKGLEVLKDGKSWKNWNSLPRVEEFDKGGYDLQFIAPGYNNKKVGIQVELGENDTISINMNRKSLAQAMLRSVLLPGLGHLYSSDNTLNPQRKRIGLIQSVAGGILSSSSLLSWGSYSNKQTTYKDANDQYLNAKTPEDVSLYRQIAYDKHAVMKSANNQAIFFTFLYSSLWVWSLVDTYLNYPYETNSRELNFQMGFQEFNESRYPTIQLSYQF